MFDGFAHVWTPVTLARRLRRDRPLAVTLASERLVFFRDAAGRASALLDQCPHRGVALSLGAVKEGCLECPFHAWRFDGAGACVAVPLNPDAKRERLFATALPTREVAGLLWVYTASGAPVGEPSFPDTLVRADLARTAFEVTWKAHWTRAMENMLDSPHVPYLHRNTIGRFVRPHLKPDTRMDIDWLETPFGATLLAWLDGDRSREGGNLEFWKPNMMVLNIGMPGQTFRIHALCVPAEEDEVRMIIIGARSFATLALLNPLFNWSNKRIADEDRAVVESSRPKRVPPPAEERSVRTDKATLQFRRYFFETLASSRAERPSEPVS
jgi:phenylpropionate dioxygenase-like ring-hydroxylating dioxygenase large terminal subunit